VDILAMSFQLMMGILLETYARSIFSIPSVFPISLLRIMASTDGWTLAIFPGGYILLPKILFSCLAGLESR
jgi:hypothetical protein